MYAAKANVPIWSTPYSKSGYIIKEMYDGEMIYLMRSFKNSVGNLWYETDAGFYIYSENLTRTAPTKLNYNRTSAVNYARNNVWSSSELCAGFVSRSVSAGGIEIYKAGPAIYIGDCWN